MAATSKTHLTTKWIPSDWGEPDFLTCKNCKDKNIKIRMAYKTNYSEMWKYCPRCGARFVKRKNKKRGGDHVKK